METQKERKTEALEIVRASLASGVAVLNNKDPFLTSIYVILASKRIHLARPARLIRLLDLSIIIVGLAAITQMQQ